MSGYSKNTALKNFSRSLELLVSQSPYTNEEICEKMGIASSTLYGWLGGKRMPRERTLQDVARFFHVTDVSLLDGSLLSDKEIESVKPAAPKAKNTIEIPIFDTAPDLYFEVEDNSMIDIGIYPKDIVFIKKGAVNNGDLALVTIDQKKRLRKVYSFPANNALFLIPENISYQARMFIGNEMKSVKIIGKVVSVQHLIPTKNTRQV